MKLIISNLLVCLLLIGSKSFAHWDLAYWSPTDVHKAAYCAELLRLSKNRNINSEIKTSVASQAAKIIEDGDNLDFVPLGIDAARQKILDSGVLVIENDLQDCSIILIEIINGLSKHPLGFDLGGLSSEEDIDYWMTELQLARTPKHDLYDVYKDENQYGFFSYYYGLIRYQILMWLGFI